MGYKVVFFKTLIVIDIIYKLIEMYDNIKLKVTKKKFVTVKTRCCNDQVHSTSLNQYSRQTNYRYYFILVYYT